MSNFPTVANVQAADLETLRYWRKHLDAPSTDVERTVIKRIDRRITEFSTKANPKAESFTSQFDELFKAMGLK